MDFGFIDESAVRLYIRIMHYYHSLLFPFIVWDIVNNPSRLEDNALKEAS